MSLNIALLTTGGTIEKTYNESDGTLGNSGSVIDSMLDGLELRGVDLHRVHLMNKDSLEMSEEDHQTIARTAHDHSESHDGVIIVHGTDRITYSGHAIMALGHPKTPIILTGAMRPFQMRNTDALQNLTEALICVQVISPGIYVSMHNRLLSFPGIQKNYEEMTFEYTGEERRRQERRRGERRTLARRDSKA